MLFEVRTQLGDEPLFVCEENKMSNYIYFTPEEKSRAQNTDLVSLLRAKGERPIRSGREYRTPNDPSVTVRGNKWYDHSERVGGYAVSFVQRYYRLPYQEAVLLMINDCLAGKIDYIITKSVSRFARNTVDCLDTVRMLKARGIGVFFEEQRIDTLTSDSELYLVIYAGFAQSESESISKNITWTYRKNFEDGKAVFIYKKLLGYKKGEDGEPEVVPCEAEIVNRIYSMFLSGMPINEISATLRDENIQIPGKEFSFSKSMILSVLRNEKYCGDCILQKSVTVDCISKTRKANEGEAPMYIVENNHPAIISRETYNRTQEELSRRNAITPKSKKNCITATGKYSRYALTEVLKCAECGSRYRRCTWTSHGKRRIVWRCINRLDYGKKFCSDSVTVLETELHEAIVRALNRFYSENEATYLALMKATIQKAATH